MFESFLVISLGGALGVVIIWKRTKLVEIIGNIGFAEEYLGAGGTYTLWLIVGVLVFIGSLMYGTGTLQSLLSSTFGMFFG